MNVDKAFYDRMMASFDDTHDYVDYIIRCWLTGDEEEFQILDDVSDSADSRQQFVDRLTDESVPVAVAEALWRVLLNYDLAHDAGREREMPDNEVIVSILQPFASACELLVHPSGYDIWHQMWDWHDDEDFDDEGGPMSFDRFIKGVKWGIDNVPGSPFQIMP